MRRRYPSEMANPQPFWAHVSPVASLYERSWWSFVLVIASFVLSLAAELAKKATRDFAIVAQH
jgi:hypothetical protein